ncbi:hypothetical protein ACFLY3_03025 [Chloroflexota bacterium]
MDLDVGLFVTIAEIAGIFVGFGALISVTRRAEIETPKLWRIRGLVTMGLGVIIAALVPIGLRRYGVTGHELWFTCSLIYLILNWTVSIWSLRKPEVRKLVITDARANPLVAVFFWLLLEVPLQVPLFLILFGSLPNLEPALYTTAIFFALFEAAFVLTQLVYSKLRKEI